MKTLDKKSQISLNENVIDLNAIKTPSVPPKDTLDEYIERFSGPVVDRYEETKRTLLLSKDVVHMIIREFCLESGFFISNGSWSIRLVVAHISDEKTLVPDKSEQFVLPSMITDRRFNVGDGVRLGRKLDNIGGAQAGPAVVRRMEHHLYSDNAGFMTLIKTFVKNEEGYNQYIEEAKKTAPTVEKFNSMVSEGAAKEDQKNNADAPQ